MKPPLPVRKMFAVRKNFEIFFFFPENNYKSQIHWEMKPPMPVKKILAVRKNFEILLSLAPLVAQRSFCMI